MNKNLHFLRRSIQKFSIYLFRITQVPVKKSEYERDCIQICKKLIKNPTTDLLLTPISGKRYINNEELQISVILNSHNVQIINHIYSYTIFIEGKEWERLIDFFNQEVESRREVLEQHITSNIKHSLQNILVNIK